MKFIYIATLLGLISCGQQDIVYHTNVVNCESIDYATTECPIKEKEIIEVEQTNVNCKRGGSVVILEDRVIVRNNCQVKIKVKKVIDS